MSGEPLTRRRIEQGGFRIHATFFKVTFLMACAVWVFVSVASGGPVFPFPLAPLLLWGPFLGLHAVAAFGPRDAREDEPIQLPWSSGSQPS